MNVEKMIKKIQFHKEIVIKLKNTMIRNKNELASSYVTHLRSLEGFLSYLEKEFKYALDLDKAEKVISKGDD